MSEQVQGVSVEAGDGGVLVQGDVDTASRESRAVGGGEVIARW